MKTILLSGAISMIVALLGTRPTITVLRKRKLGQQIRTDGPQAPPEQERHADHGRHRHHHRLAGRLRARAPGSPATR